MDIKTFLRDPQVGLEQLGIAAGGASAADLLQQAEHINEQRRHLKMLKADKAQVARAFKTVENATPEHTQLIERMQSVSARLKGLESDLKESEKRLRQALAKKEPAPESAPVPLYTIPEQTYDGPFQIRELNTGQMASWCEFVDAQKNAPAYCSAPWRNAIQSVFGHRTRVWVAESSSGEIIGGVPLTFFRSRLFGRFAVSVPYFNYGGVLTSYLNVAQDLLAELQQVCERENLDHIEIRTLQPALWPNSANEKVSMVLPLPENQQQLERQLGSKVRAQCKKAGRYQPVIRFGALDLLDDFYHVFATNMRDLGTPVYTKKWFATLLAQADITATIAVVYLADKPVSAGFLVGHNKVLEIPWASTIKSANAMDTNMWMYRQLLDYAVENGYRFFDFGRSSRDAGTYRFKKQWGAQPHEHYWYYLLPPGGRMPALNPSNPKYKLIIGAWKRLPVWLTKVIGPPLVKNIP